MSRTAQPGFGVSSGSRYQNYKFTELAKEVQDKDKMDQEAFGNGGSTLVRCLEQQKELEVAEVLWAADPPVSELHFLVFLGFLCLLPMWHHLESKSLVLSRV